ncbi:hypothetical protein GYMLUDRAFT_833975 [Collybiopsis luxurians FD-317 M1]|uniref:Uncharacterized protein n=1 Tax=Collybiopsis luxurians FD-317 M1 TaxID=944289 RepID=A0A0D0AYB7_9AGAR|nr:hypothetical protein GYMLUDRAFT_833975 [Collybiopsis luxurians FD-317 M1]
MSSYDASLLASAPQATNAMKREGYDPHLLEQEQKATAAQARAANGNGSGSASDLNAKEYPPYPHTNANDRGFPSARRQTPFWRTRNGIIFIVVLSAVVLAAVIGGAVGGTRHKSHAITTPDQNQTSSASGPAPAQSVGSASGSASATGSPTTTITTTFATTIPVLSFSGLQGGQSITTTITTTETLFAPASTSSSSSSDQTSGNQGASGNGDSGNTIPGTKPNSRSEPKVIRRWGRGWVRGKREN